MRKARPDRFAMETLRGDLPAVSLLAAALLLVQILIAGLGAGAALAGPVDRHLCTASAGVATSPGRKTVDHGQICPCLAAGSCSTSLGGAIPAGGAAPILVPTLVVQAKVERGVAMHPERRPLVLFGRASRGPPSVT